MKKYLLITVCIIAFILGGSVAVLAGGDSCEPPPPPNNLCPSCVHGSGGIIGGLYYTSVNTSGGLTAGSGFHGNFEFQGPNSGKGITNGAASLEVNEWENGFNITTEAHVVTNVKAW